VAPDKTSTDAPKRRGCPTKEATVAVVVPAPQKKRGRPLKVQAAAKEAVVEEVKLKARSTSNKALDTHQLKGEQMFRLDKQYPTLRYTLRVGTYLGLEPSPDPCWQFSLLLRPAWLGPRGSRLLARTFRIFLLLALSALLPLHLGNSIRVRGFF
jgi:hypothetical protein